MKILALEFSSQERNVAVAVDGAVCGSAAETVTRATPAFALIEHALEQAKIRREEIGCLAVGLGPGSYTGIRAAIALAQGWQLALPVKLLGVSSVECLVAEAQTQGWFGNVNFIVDAQRGELYFARYEIRRDMFREISPLKLSTLEQVRAESHEGEIIAGPEAGKWFAQGKNLFPAASTLARIAAARNGFVPGDKLEPIYLRETTFVKAPAPRLIPNA